MSEIKQYDTEVRLEAVMGTNHYGVHIHAMTKEDLHSKSDIAVELAWRDLRIEQLIAQLEASQKENGVVRNKYESMSTAYSSVTAELAKAEAELSAANEKLQVPTGYCIMPESLTAENGAKGALSGEFFTVTEIACEECCCDYDEDDPCENCNGFGVKKVRTAIGWSTIKDIYKMAVGATAIRPVGFTVEGE